ncbi:Transforming growth factor-beta-induced protein ig-h3, partial [Fragariocoptes setiger]
ESNDFQEAAHSHRSNNNNDHTKFANIDSNNAQINRKNLARNDLLRLLSIFEGELQSREITIAVLKSEQLKRLVNPIHINSGMAKRYRQLLHSLNTKRIHSGRNNKNILKNNNDGVTKNNNNCSIICGNQNDSSNDAKMKDVPQGCEKPSSSTQNQPTIDRSTNPELRLVCQSGVGPSGPSATIENDEFLLLNETLELLERNPLLALSQDAMYMLDFDCDEMATRNYLNLKIQHLEHIIGQHRRYRHYMNERLQLAERKCLELSLELERERQSRRQQEHNRYVLNERSSLLAQCEHYKKCIEDEREKKQNIIFTLLNDLLDEREKREELERQLCEQKTKMTEIMENTNVMVADLKEESERSLIMESELSNMATQLHKQSESFDKERNDLKLKLDTLQAKNADLTAHIEQTAAAQQSIPATGMVNNKPTTGSVRSNRSSTSNTSSSAISANVSSVRGQSNTKVPSPTRSSASHTLNTSSSTVHRSSSGSLIRSSGQSPALVRKSTSLSSSSPSSSSSSTTTTTTKSQQESSSPQRSSSTSSAYNSVTARASNVSSTSSVANSGSNSVSSNSSTNSTGTIRSKASLSITGASNTTIGGSTIRTTTSNKPQVPAKPAIRSTRADGTRNSVWTNVASLRRIKRQFAPPAGTYGQRSGAAEAARVKPSLSRRSSMPTVDLSSLGDDSLLLAHGGSSVSPLNVVQQLADRGNSNNNYSNNDLDMDAASLHASSRRQKLTSALSNMQHLMNFFERHKLSKFNELLQLEGNVSRELDTSREPFTLFVPTNEALMLLPASLLDSIIGDARQLTQFIASHVILGSLVVPQQQQQSSTNNNAMATTMTFQSLNNQPVRVAWTASSTNHEQTSNNSTYEIIDGNQTTSLTSSSSLSREPEMTGIVNGANIVCGMSHVLAASSGARPVAVVHVVDKALYPGPAGDIMHKIRQMAPQMAQYMRLVGVDLNSNSNNDDGWTVFAPNDEAFRGAPTALLQALANNVTFARAMLNNHILRGARFAAELVSTNQQQQSLNAVSGLPLRFGQTTAQARHLVLVNGIPIVEADQMAANNGIVHVVTRPITADTAHTVTLSLSDMELTSAGSSLTGCHTHKCSQMTTTSNNNNNNNLDDLTDKNNNDVLGVWQRTLGQIAANNNGSQLVTVSSAGDASIAVPGNNQQVDNNQLLASELADEANRLANLESAFTYQVAARTHRQAGAPGAHELPQIIAHNNRNFYRPSTVATPAPTAHQAHLSAGIPATAVPSNSIATSSHSISSNPIGERERERESTHENIREESSSVSSIKTSTSSGNASARQPQVIVSRDRLVPQINQRPPVAQTFVNNFIQNLPASSQHQTANKNVSTTNYNNNNDVRPFKIYLWEPSNNNNRATFATLSNTTTYVADFVNDQQQQQQQPVLGFNRTQSQSMRPIIKSERIRAEPNINSNPSASMSGSRFTYDHVGGHHNSLGMVTTPSLIKFSLADATPTTQSSAPFDTLMLASNQSVQLAAKSVSQQQQPTSGSCAFYDLSCRRRAANSELASISQQQQKQQQQQQVNGNKDSLAQLSRFVTAPKLSPLAQPLPPWTGDESHQLLLSHAQQQLSPTSDLSRLLPNTQTGGHHRHSKTLSANHGGHGHGFAAGLARQSSNLSSTATPPSATPIQMVILPRPSAAIPSTSAGERSKSEGFFSPLLARTQTSAQSSANNNKQAAQTVVVSTPFYTTPINVQPTTSTASPSFIDSFIANANDNKQQPARPKQRVPVQVLSSKFPLPPSSHRKQRLQQQSQHLQQQQQQVQIESSLSVKEPQLVAGARIRLPVQTLTSGQFQSRVPTSMTTFNGANFANTDHSLATKQQHLDVSATAASPNVTPATPTNLNLHTDTIGATNAAGEFFQNRSIADIMSDSGLRIDGRLVTFNKLKQCLSDSGLLSLIMQSTQPITIFMPSDGAFERLVREQPALPSSLVRSSARSEQQPRNGERELDCTSPVVRQLLLDHMSVRQVTPRELSDDLVVPSVSHRRLIMSSIPAKKIVVVDGQPVVAATRANNGMVYVLDKFINVTQQVPSITDILRNEPQLSTFSAYLRLSGLDSLIQRETGPITLLAPTNDAFASLPASAQIMLEADPAGLRDILSGHVVDGAKFAKLIAMRHKLRTLNSDQYIEVKGLRPNVYLLNNQATSVKQVGTAANGVVNAIDRVLLPKWFTLAMTTSASANQPTTTTTMAKTTTTPSGREIENIDFVPADRRSPAHSFFDRSSSPIRLRSVDTSSADIASSSAFGDDSFTTLSANSSNNNSAFNSGLWPPTSTFRASIVNNNNNLNNNVDMTNINSTASVNESANMRLIEKLAPMIQSKRFVRMLNVAGVARQLKSGTSYVILVPTDAAIEKLPRQIITMLDRNTGKLQDLVNYHILETTFEYINMIPDGQTLTTVNDKDIIFNWHRNNTVLTASGSVVMGGVQEDNLALLVVDRVLYPTPGDILDIISKSPILSNFTQMVRGTGMDQELSKSGPYTLFAPSDMAFQSVQAQDLEFLLRNKEAARRFLLRHLSQPITFTSSIALSNTTSVLSNGRQVPSLVINNLLGEDLTLRQRDDYFSVNDVNFSYADVAATNGVIHVIDGIIER